MSVSQAWQKSGTAEFTARWGPSTGVIIADGELDAANADLLAEFVHRCSQHRDRLVLDLRGLEFIGTAGFSALHRINVACSEAQADWSMIPSAAVTRLLQICDPDGSLPILRLDGDAAGELDGVQPGPIAAGPEVALAT
ncbi:STAS domain-containing protein [Mycobacterium bourgelatii]|uniref:STAS domain-containing protein n=1 Tax=Mycobacterium bourgelatii TaxID=1273442 RepID=A0A7I9YJN6_MYCBU|nr:STAS domain-containing protein [Mycobacterium bourgelatii]MCV6973533.1 STAS domain-containing protein [Mycobacterium bourgelatii]GFG88894.1 hypothetical protein MBOU_09360 [Mycobacterium bourgelatii]